MRQSFSFLLSLLLILTGCAKKPKNVNNEDAYGDLGNKERSKHGSKKGRKSSDVYDQKQKILDVNGNYLLLDRVFFGFDSNRLNNESIDVLSKYFSAVQKENLTGKTLLIEGHTDKRGTAEYNIALGYRRANMVKKELRKLGFKGEVEIKSYGKFKPYIDEDNDNAYSQNRRVEFFLLEQE